MSAERIVALLGRRDKPTDGVADYWRFLSEALVPLGYAVDLVRVPWAERGWRSSLDELRRKARDWRGRWVLLQYTALSWSRRGFPLSVLRVLRILAQSGARIGIVFHDVGPYPGTRLIDRLRCRMQIGVMRRLYAAAERVILTVPVEKISWLPAQRAKATFIPVGANLPEPSADGDSRRASPNKAKTVAVFSVTGSGQTMREVRDIGYAVKRAQRSSGPLRLVVIGRGSEEAGPALRAELNGAAVEVTMLGLVSSEELSWTLAGADVLLFVRGQLSSRRTSAIAGIACGLPVVGYCGDETGFPVTEAGVLLAPLYDRDALAEELERVLSDDALRAQLRQRSRAAQKAYFGWDAIARRYREVFGNV